MSRFIPQQNELAGIALFVFGGTFSCALFQWVASKPDWTILTFGVPTIIAGVYGFVALSARTRLTMQDAPA